MQQRLPLRRLSLFARTDQQRDYEHDDDQGDRDARNPLPRIPVAHDHSEGQMPIWAGWGTTKEGPESFRPRTV